MPKNSKPYGLSGEPWHVEYLRTESDDDRRDKRRCLFFEKGNYCSKKGERCIGSSHCDHYKEKAARPQASKYLHEDGRYYHVKDSVEKTSVRSAAVVGGKDESRNNRILFHDYVDPTIRIQTYKSVRYAPGTEVISRNLGKGIILSANDGHYSVEFNSKTSIFMMDAFDKGFLTATGSAREEVVYQAVVIHSYLPAFYVIEGDTEYSVNQRIGIIKSQLIKEWNNRLEGLKDTRSTTMKCMEVANRQTVWTARVRHQLETIAEENNPPHLIDFEKQSRISYYNIPEPDYPQYKLIPREPMIEDYGRVRKMGFIQKLFKLSPIKISRVNKDQYESDHLVWERAKQQAEYENSLLYENYVATYNQWERNRDMFVASEEARIQKVRGWHTELQKGDTTAIEKYFVELLDRIKVPLWFERKYDIDYDVLSRSVVIDFCLPSLEAIPRMKRTTYQDSSNSFIEDYYSSEDTRELQKKVNEQVVSLVLTTIEAGAKAEQIRLKSIMVKGYCERIDDKLQMVVRDYIQNSDRKII